MGRQRPQTPILLTAEAHDAYTIHLTWQWDTLSCPRSNVFVDSFRIWYAPDTTVPFTWKFDTNTYKQIEDKWLR